MVTESPDRLLRLAEVLTLTALAHSSIYRKMREGSFPEPLKVGVRAVRWWRSDIQAWLADCPRATGDTPF